MVQLPHVPPMSKLQILHKAHEFWLEYVREVGPEYILNCGVNFDEMYEVVLYPKYEIVLVTDEDLGVDDEGTAILGKFLPKDNTALVDKKLFEERDPRRVFIEGHEVIGHGILHGPFLRKNAYKFPKLYSTEKGIDPTQNRFNWKTFNTFEQQANTFAANVMAPRIYVWCMFIKLFGMRRKIRYCGPGKYSLCYNNNNWFVYVSSPLELAWKIAKRMKHYFWGLSAESLSYQVLKVAIDTNGYDRGKLWGQKYAFTVGDII